MKKYFTCLIFVIALLIPTYSFADLYDTGHVTSPATTGTSESADTYWGYYKQTGTRYILRVYDDIARKYIAVPKEYYINHVGSESNYEYIFLGADKTKDGKYEIVKSGQKIFENSIYNHPIKWFESSDIENFGLTNEEVNMLAGIVKSEAQKRGDIAVHNSMQNIISGKVAYDVRAEILFLLKLPDTKGNTLIATVHGDVSTEKYQIVCYENSSRDTAKYRRDYFTFREVQAIAVARAKRGGANIGWVKRNWLNEIASSLYEKDKNYVFANGRYQCSCDMYRIYYPETKYTLEKLPNPVGVENDRRIIVSNMNTWGGDGQKLDLDYALPGWCGLPVNINGTTKYVVAGGEYFPLTSSVFLTRLQDTYIRFKNVNLDENGYIFRTYKGKPPSFLKQDATSPIICEGWDYITNNLAMLMVVGVDKSTGQVITINGTKYSEYREVSADTYKKSAWDIDGYKYVGQKIVDGFNIPNPLSETSKDKDASVTFSANDVLQNTKKQIIFIYEKEERVDIKLSILKKQDDNYSAMHEGNFLVKAQNKLDIAIGNFNSSFSYDDKIGYNINTKNLEESLNIDATANKYLGYVIKQNPEVYLNYKGEELNSGDGDIYNIKDAGKNKVHVIIVYEELKPKPQIKISYVDVEGNPILNMPEEISEENQNESIIKVAKDLKDQKFIYKGYVYIDSKNEFENIEKIPQAMSKSSSVVTVLKESDDRRHIYFIYKKREIKFNIDIELNVNDLPNQYIHQNANEDYWVLDEEGKAYISVSAENAEDVQIIYKKLSLRLPFDIIKDDEFISKNTIQEIDLTNKNADEKILIASKLLVPIWVEEKEYDVVANVEAEVVGEGSVRGVAKDNVIVVGRLYDFTLTNLDGSPSTGDEKWKGTLFENESVEYKAHSFPIGQNQNQPQKYNYGIKLGTMFYFSVNTKGIKNNSIQIKPEFLYVSKDAKKQERVTVYAIENGKKINIKSQSTMQRSAKLTDVNIFKKALYEESTRAEGISRYAYNITQNRNIGNLGVSKIPRELSLPYLGYINEFKMQYGSNMLTKSSKAENDLLVYATHWYSKYNVPSAVVIENANGEVKSDGFLIVYFNIISKDSADGEYLAYTLPQSKNQWVRENLKYDIALPQKNETQILRNILLNNIFGYAPVIIYDIGVSTKDNNTSIGTH